MDLEIAGKTAIVTGGSQGIGRAVVLRLAREGCRVGLVARSQGPIDEAVSLVRQQGGEAIGISADCTTEDGIKRAVSQTAEAFGPIEIAVFNADSGPKGPFLEMSDEQFLQSNRHNVMSFIWYVRAVMPFMRERQWGRILTIGTNSVKQPHRRLKRAGPNTYRVGALALSKTMADELGPMGITINTLGTGGIETDQFKRLYQAHADARNSTYEAELADLVATLPVRRMGQPEDMADAAAFLCSVRSGYITGQVLLVDGGQIESLQ
jgi:3-oxoacyl-[acyl-carrier protein] reductase